MISTRRISVSTGVLFIVATVSAITATSLLPDLTGADYLADVASHPLRVAVSALGTVLAAATSASIAVAMYPLLRRTHAALALGSVIFRTIEAVFYVVGVVSLLSIATLGKDLAAGAAGDRAPIQAVADALLTVREHSSLVAVLAFATGSFLYSVVFYRARLLPRWLSAWGILAAVLMAVACVPSLINDAPITGYIPLVVPVFLQEIVLAVWLLVRGFHPQALGSKELSPSGAVPGL